ncbi:MAG: cupin domain-containing protein [Chloroflexia bacterium]|nr:cupin domain-containing protein [Chloroflexia bacterium]
MIAMPTNQWTVLIAGEQTGGRFAVVEARVRQGADFPRHVHSREDELIFVLEGRVTFDRDGERLDGPAGTWLSLPRGCEHTFAVESAEARLLVVLSPAGLEHCQCEADTSDDATADQRGVERLVANAARYGVAITGPARPP